MATARFPVPNEDQELIAVAVGLDPKNVAVRLDDDTSIVFLQYMPRTEFYINKKTGEMQEC